jgi:hypothetical protein
MTPINIAILVNLLGFTAGLALYTMLLLMVITHPAQSVEKGSIKLSPKLILLPFATSVLGLLWNIGGLYIYGLGGLGIQHISFLVGAISFSSLGFLPAVVVHTTFIQTEKNEKSALWWLTVIAYCLSSFSALMQFYVSITTGTFPSQFALKILTAGYIFLTISLFLITRSQPGGRRAAWAIALAVFAISALHLSQHNGHDSWLSELIGHHASLPLALAILYQDYRFAFADLFLKRVLSLITLIIIVSGLYLLIISPLLLTYYKHDHDDPVGVAVLLGLWIVTTLMYPSINHGVSRFVDSVILQRVNYDELRSDISSSIFKCKYPETVLDEVSQVLANALTANNVRWSEAGEFPSLYNFEQAAEVDVTNVNINSGIQKPELSDNCVVLTRRSLEGTAVVFIPTSEPPFYILYIGKLYGGRRLLSDEIAILNSVAVLVARRIDVLRVTHERCEQEVREQEISKLATEAQLQTLRAQINPHFLFNALTTIGYLIRTSPNKALDTLMQLTGLLRGVLRSTGEFSTLNEELSLLESYLGIEKARFEERLTVRIDVPNEIRSLTLPSLLIQPLVENSIKHGISQTKAGGEVSVSARVIESDMGQILNIVVCDTGAGTSEIKMAADRRKGYGLSNIEKRLEKYYGGEASLHIKSTPHVGTVVEVNLPTSASLNKSNLALSQEDLFNSKRKNA